MGQQVKVNSWDRQISDTDKSYQAFREYLDLGPKRTVMGLSRLLKKDRSMLHQWSRDHKWKMRAYDYDQAMGASAKASRQKELVKLQQEIIEDAHYDYSAMIIRWRKLMTSGELSIDDLGKLVEMRDKLDKIARRIAEMPTTYRIATKPEELDTPSRKQLTWGTSDVPMLVDGKTVVEDEGEEDEFESWESAVD